VVTYTDGLFNNGLAGNCRSTDCLAKLLLQYLTVINDNPTKFIDRLIHNFKEGGKVDLTDDVAVMLLKTN
jgi:hypothetical protein